jgi:stage II sporulation SpoAA-like protein
MIEILTAPPHVAAFHFQGTLTAGDYDRCIAEIEGRLAAHERIGIFSDLTGMTGITAEAMGRDLRFALGKMGEFHRFARGAIVTERDWLARITKFSALFFPHTEIRTFAPDQREVALVWVGGKSSPA